MSEKKIPRIIHYCWFGGKDKPKKVQKCLRSWKKYCPDYEIIEWNESNFDVNINKYTSGAYKEKRWGFVTDYVRCYVVNKYGGVYFDTDVELIRPIDELLSYDAFFASEDGIHINTGIGFGSKPNNKLLKLIIEDYDRVSFYNKNGRADLLTCPVRNTRLIKKVYPDIGFDKSVVVDNMIFLSKEYFCPLDYETKKMRITGKTYGIHWFSGSWQTPNERIRRAVKRRVKSLLGRGR